MHSTIIIIGGGAAGLMAARSAALSGAETLVIEKMPRPGRKIMITGKGRCNFTNVKPWEEFSAHIRSKANFLRPSFYNLNPGKTISLLESLGLETVVERGDRAFPASHKSMDVVDILVRGATTAGAKIICNTAIQDIERTGDGFRLHAADGKEFSCEKLIIATGGLSYPSTGSTGDGYAWAEKAGHKITPLFPSLTAMVPEGYKTVGKTADGHIHRDTPVSGMGRALQGNSLKNVEVSLSINGTVVRKEFGDIDFTDGGIEGPIGFTLSRDCVKAIVNGAKVSLELDLKPGVTPEQVKDRVCKLWREVWNDPRSTRLSSSGILKVMLGKLMPWELAEGFIRWNKDVISGKGRKESVNLDAVANALKHWNFKIAGYVGYERCVVTAGGVSTDEVFPKTMESRLCKGLYFCGEVLDADSDTGGYNLQTAFSTGFLAGSSAAR